MSGGKQIGFKPVKGHGMRSKYSELKLWCRRGGVGGLGGPVGVCGAVNKTTDITAIKMKQEGNLLGRWPGVDQHSALTAVGSPPDDPETSSEGEEQ